MTNFVKWMQTHSPALVAFASAVGVFAHAFVPAFAEATGEGAQAIFVVTGIVGAVLAAYAQAATNEG